MNTQLDTRALALAGTATGAALVALCFAIYAILGRPDPWMDLFIGSGPSLGGWLVGIVEGAAVGAVTGWFVAVTYNRVARPAAGSR